MKGDDFRGAAEALIDHDDVEGVLSGRFYTSAPPSSSRPPRAKTIPPKPEHYKVICISLYKRDLSQLDAMVDKLKERGYLVTEWMGLTIWGRQCTGQAILLDYVINCICSELYNNNHYFPDQLLERNND